jgi:hypothetical protein
MYGLVLRYRNYFASFTQVPYFYNVEIKAYEIVVGKPEGKTPLGRPRSIRKDKITTDLKDAI